MQNFKVATCTELYQTPVLKAVKSLKELCFELNKREDKTSRDRQLIYEYSLLPCYSTTTSKRLTQELNKVPYTAMDSLKLIDLLYDDVNDTSQFYSFLKRDLAAILFINHPLYPDSLLDLTIRQTLSTLVFNSKKNPEECTFDYRCRALDDYISPYGQLFLKELTGFVVSPFFTSSNSIQQYDKWIKYEEPRPV
ncbi:hypothetical protein DSO57_1020638 [Entomophthora muscae]|uniref:Uncharacterized protein n=1 Tax=Entomophthora muscae TaxID=34485 RepID=A0ACC2RUM2_9FUNG|nr:hypothetical protein DSO57_1020638 [Entomophthora muscae]